MLSFGLTYHAHSKMYTLVGGPLSRTFTLKEWHKFVKDQGCETYYGRWAEEARGKPGLAIMRSPGSKEGRD